MDGILKLINFVIDNWSLIGAAIIFIIACVKKVKNFLNKSKEEKFLIAKQQIKSTILKWVSEAEIDYEDIVKAGEIKRSQVIQNIYNEYPVLSKIIDQEIIIAYIDECIDESLKTLREVIEINENSFVITTKGDE